MTTQPSGKLVKELELAQLRALSSPARQEILEAVQTCSPCSIAEIAEYLGRPADSLYYHMRNLTKVGLLKEHSTRKAKRREEVLYEAPRHIRPGSLVACNPDNPERRKVVAKSTAAMLRATARNFAEAYEKGLAVPRGSQRNIAAARYKGWVTVEEVQHILHHMGEIKKILCRRRNGNGGGYSLHAASLVLTPLEPKGNGKNGSEDDCE